MEPVKFPAQNCVVGGEVPANKSNGIILSRWKVSIRERLSILFGGHVWLAVRSETQPPILLSGDSEFTIGN